MTEFFKGDARELQVYNSVNPTLESIGLSIDAYFADVYGSVPMGEFLYDEKRVPLTNAIKREIFIRSFKQIFDSWKFPGTFESYILVFKKIFGEGVIIEFTVPAAGKLNIDIEATGLAEYNWIAREIVNNAYVDSNLVTSDGDQLIFDSIQGIETEDELNKVLFIMVPNGIYTQISLTIGS